MTEFEQASEELRLAADTAGMAELAREAGVPYTTVHAFQGRGWSNKNLDVFERLLIAARRINERTSKGAAA